MTQFLVNRTVRLLGRIRYITARSFVRRGLGHGFSLQGLDLNGNPLFRAPLVFHWITRPVGIVNTFGLPFFISVQYCVD